MEASITLWKCPPLRARISQRQCALNRSRAETSEDPLAQGPAQCIGCRGLEWWAEQTGELPWQLEAREVARQHALKDALRRRLGGLPPAPPPASLQRRGRTRALRRAMSYSVAGAPLIEPPPAPAGLHRGVSAFPPPRCCARARERTPRRTRSGARC
jgi:hypothetical protein